MSDQTINLVTIKARRGGTRRVNAINRALVALRNAQTRADKHTDPAKRAACLAAGSHNAQLWLTHRHPKIVR